MRHTGNVLGMALSAAALFFVCITAANAQLSNATDINTDGHEIEVITSHIIDHIVQFDEHILLSDHVDQFVFLAGPFSDGSHTFVLIDEAPGGNACGGNFQAFEISGSIPKLSKQFGNCDDEATVWVAGGILHVLTPQYRVAGMSGNMVPAASYTFTQGVLTEAKSPS